MECADLSRSLVHRVFHCDAVSYQGKAHYPVTRNSIDFARIVTAEPRPKLFEQLRGLRDTAVRSGEVRQKGDREIKIRVLNELLRKRRALEE